MAQNGTVYACLSRFDSVPTRCEVGVTRVLPVPAVVTSIKPAKGGWQHKLHAVCLNCDGLGLDCDVEPVIWHTAMRDWQNQHYGIAEVVYDCQFTQRRLAHRAAGLGSWRSMRPPSAQQDWQHCCTPLGLFSYNPRTWRRYRFTQLHRGPRESAARLATAQQALQLPAAPPRTRRRLHCPGGNCKQHGHYSHMTALRPPSPKRRRLHHTVQKRTGGHYLSGMPRSSASRHSDHVDIGVSSQQSPARRDTWMRIFRQRT